MLFVVPMWQSLVARASKKNLRLKCSQCRQLLPAEHFINKRGPAHSLVCAHCKRLCVVCGVRLGLDSFSEGSEDICDKCLAKEQVAKQNVYFRYPVLQYRACPYSVDEMREDIMKENQKK